MATAPSSAHRWGFMGSKLNRNIIRTEEFRQDLVAILGEDRNLVPVVFHINECVYGPQIAKWLIKNGFVGRKMSEWLHCKHMGSVLSMIKFVTAENNRTNGLKPFIAGKDYLRKI